MPDIDKLYFRGVESLTRISKGLRGQTDFEVACLVAEGMVCIDGRTLTDAGKVLLGQWSDFLQERAAREARLVEGVKEWKKDQDKKPAKAWA